ncbi:Hypothetical protein LUCI_4581 [Lucifera butyrica]|uniref:SLH domain-containing protein n=1 Tax=Lucifera butyrica TaxID=1351585 RepID=A0A498RCX1_9FIRM|nr:S-layer homology domain-containing protein [Lucifera butyrica]VBB09291.1 Hypothetical protein LUCI_4581 [Lucifera butyrica]
MKKSLIITLALVFVLGIAGTAFAANPFVDVPAKHWAYGAVAKLAADGVIDGYGDGTFRGDKTLTRYEMAQIVAKAMANQDKASAQDKALIEKLSTEFSQELDNLGVRVSNLENKVDNVKWGGEVRLRYDSRSQAGSSTTAGAHSTAGDSYVDMWATAQINPDWVGKVEYEANRFTNTGAVDATDPATRIYAQGKAFGGTLTLGKFNPFAAYGLIIDDNMTGAQFQFGNTLKTRIAVGRLADSTTALGFPQFGNYATNAAAVNYPSYRAVEFDLAASPVTNIKAAYHRVGGYSVTGAAPYDKTANYLEAGFDTKLADDWSFMADYAKSNIDIANQSNKGYFTQLQYKAADVKTVGSYDIFANYRKIPLNSEIDSTWDYARDIKGVQLGFDYVPMLNTKFQAFYLKGKTITDNNDANVFRAQVEFFF